MEIIMDKRKSFTLADLAAIISAVTGLLRLAHECGWL